LLEVVRNESPITRKLRPGRRAIKAVGRQSGSAGRSRLDLRDYSQTRRAVTVGVVGRSWSGRCAIAALGR
jgi:hypothetical protein